jgi:hypothetical protein
MIRILRKRFRKRYRKRLLLSFILIIITKGIIEADPFFA